MVKSVRPNTGLKGTDIVLSNLNKQLNGIKLRSAKGLIQSANLVRNDMDKQSPKIPVDTGNLRASWRVIPGKGIKGFFVLMGFMANYAVFVHEMMGATFNREGSGAKFFESSLKRNKEKIMLILQKNAKV